VFGYPAAFNVRTTLYNFVQSGVLVGIRVTKLVG